MFENLERRQLLSSSLSKGILQVTGTSGNNTIDVTTSGSKIVVNEHTGSTKSYSGVTKIQVNGEGGNDRITISSSIKLPTVLSGGTGNDTLTGGSGKDALDGGDGNDVLDGGAGADYLNGNTGSDTANYSSRTKEIKAEIDVTSDGEGQPVTRAGKETTDGDVFAGIETVLGGSGNDQLKFLWKDKSDGAHEIPVGSYLLDGGKGNDNFNVLGPGFGDEIDDDGGNSLLARGGDGNDTFTGDDFTNGISIKYEGDAGNDTFNTSTYQAIDGGSGYDFEDVVGASGDGSLDAIVQMSPGIEHIRVGVGGESVDQVIGNDLDDLIEVGGPGAGVSIDGKGGNDKIIVTDDSTQDGGYDINGGDGNDTIMGNIGDDGIHGGAGNDVIHGGGGDDALYGEDGNDSLFAKDGSHDTLDGGSGKDKAQVDAVDSLTSIETIQL